MSEQHEDQPQRTPAFGTPPEWMPEDRREAWFAAHERYLADRALLLEDHRKALAVLAAAYDERQAKRDARFLQELEKIAAGAQHEAERKGAH